MTYDLNTLTDLEKVVLQASIAFWNYGDRSEKDDNAVAFNAKELAMECPDLNINTIKGVMGSLHKKGLFEAVEIGAHGQIIESGMSDLGIDVVCDLHEI